MSPPSPLPRKKEKVQKNLDNSAKKKKLKRAREDNENEIEEEGEGEEVEEIKKEVKNSGTGTGTGSGIMSTEAFTSLPISENTMKAIKDVKFEYMTQIQARAIPPAKMFLELQGQVLVKPLPFLYQLWSCCIRFNLLLAMGLVLLLFAQ